MNTRLRYGLLGIVTLAAGCLVGRSYTPIIRYAVDPGVAVEHAESTSRTLGVRPLTPARPYTKAKIIYRTDDYELGQYDCAEWAELPCDVVTRALIDALVASNRFNDVGNALDMTAPDLVLTGQLRRFDEIRSATGERKALCEMRLELRKGGEQGVLWAETLSAEAPIEGHGVAALPPAMGRAVGEIILRAVAGIARQ